MIGRTVYILKKKPTMVGIWKSHDGKTINQIYHILISYLNRSYLLDIKSYREASVVKWSTNRGNKMKTVFITKKKRK